jgi:hypothetical protein
MRGNDANAAATKALIAKPAITTIFEAAFLSGAYVAKADILRRQGRGWHVVKVKMNLEGTEALPDLIDDLTYKVMLARRCNVKVIAASLMLLSRDYRRGMNVDRLFVESDHTAEVAARLKEPEGTLTDTDKLTGANDPPQPTLCGHCRDCDYFGSVCVGKDVQYPVLGLPSIQVKRLLEFATLGVIDIEAIPLGFKLSKKQQIVCNCVRTKKPFVGRSLANNLAAVAWPARYLDFESVMTPLPLYDGMPPFTQVLTQYSVHKCSAPGVVQEHREYLADTARNCERELAERLIHDLGDEGSVIVYSHFESTWIKSLSKRFPDLADALAAVLERLFDLLPVIRDGYCHPEFGGSFSIKKTLPALVKGMSYKGLAIGDGDTAVACFAKMAMGRYSASEAKVIRESLLRYCEQDTFAMVKLHESLLQAAE